MRCLYYLSEHHHLHSPFSIPIHFHIHWRVSMRHLRFCRPFSDLPPLLHVVPVDPRHSLYNPVVPFQFTSPTSVLLSFARTVVAFHIAYRTNLKSFFFQERKSERMGAFFVNIIFTRNPPICIAYRHCHFSLFSSFYYLLLSPLQSTSTSTCPLCAPNYSMNKHYTVRSTSRPLVGLSRLVIPHARVGTPPVLSPGQERKGKDGTFIQDSRAG